ncbi:MAG: TetR-family transcriptional regulator [Amycolatopsis sp.]|jgi:AcrR family transcriptional regulator|uniref:TetR/AcrR family transcriptional regulator n=1 Tax=Amycolatopsis sp. TaxID=37632 RepID=UPI00260BCED7|nr:TetR/AcrR family transcriptional regulator [Amycolatopsis sp.]MCU1687720.1 TetR-family transcriptional regulator [Amycolatopsis sp.]
MPVEPGQPPRRRVRDPQLHREAILEAAAQAFAERGYRQATVRDIARRAGVTHGLVLRHFGSKERLFVAAVPGTRDIAGLASSVPADLPEQVAAGYVHRMETAPAGDPILALIRSAADGDASTTALYLAMHAETEAVYREVLEDPATVANLPFFEAVLIGVTLSRYILRSGPMAELSVEEFTAHLTRCLRAVLFDTAADRLR